MTYQINTSLTLITFLPAFKTKIRGETLVEPRIFKPNFVKHNYCNECNNTINMCYNNSITNIGVSQGILFTSSQLDTYSEKTKRESFITWRHVYAT